ncbi:hypothetical protein ACI797_16635 [Geodermatophilus sp. SYSU D00691]
MGPSAEVERLVLFRFDRDPLVCRDHVALLRRANPGVPVHGLYGGPRGAHGAAVRLFGAPLIGLDSLYLSRRPPLWNWKNGDLAVLDWFREVGHRLRFDVLHVLEWDLLVLEPLAEAFSAVPPDAVGLTALRTAAEVPPNWRWTTGSTERPEFEALLRHVRATWPDVTTRVCLGCGPCFPRRFLEAYAAADPPDWGNDEVRLPLYADALDHGPVDTRLTQWPTAPGADRFFNVGGATVEPADVLAALRQPSGRRTFHPVRSRVVGAHALLVEPASEHRP